MQRSGGEIIFPEGIQICPEPRIYAGESLKVGSVVKAWMGSLSQATNGLSTGVEVS